MSKFERFGDWLAFTKSGAAVLYVVSSVVALGIVYGLFAMFAAAAGL